MKRFQTLLSALSLLLGLALSAQATENASWGALKNYVAQEDGAAKLAVSAHRAGGGPFKVDVMTRNLYLGARIDAVVAAQSLAEVPGLVAQTWDAMLATDLPERAKVSMS